MKAKCLPRFLQEDDRLQLTDLNVSGLRWKSQQCASLTQLCSHHSPHPRMAFSLQLSEDCNICTDGFPIAMHIPLILGATRAPALEQRLNDAMHSPIVHVYPPVLIGKQCQVAITTLAPS